MPCDCIKKVDAELAKNGGRLAVAYGIDSDLNLTHTSVKIVVEKLDKSKRGSKPNSIVGEFCPFCGAHNYKEAS